MSSESWQIAGDSRGPSPHPDLPRAHLSRRARAHPRRARPSPLGLPQHRPPPARRARLLHELQPQRPVPDHREGGRLRFPGPLHLQGGALLAPRHAEEDRPALRQRERFRDDPRGALRTPRRPRARLPPGPHPRGSDRSGAARSRLRVHERGGGGPRSPDLRSIVLARRCGPPTHQPAGHRRPPRAPPRPEGKPGGDRLALPEERDVDHAREPRRDLLPIRPR